MSEKIDPEKFIKSLQARFPDGLDNQEVLELSKTFTEEEFRIFFINQAHNNQRELEEFIDLLTANVNELKRRVTKLEEK